MRKGSHSVVNVNGMMSAVGDGGARLFVSRVGVAYADNHTRLACGVDAGHGAE